MVYPHLDTIQQLPEVAAAIEDPTEAINHLQRSVEVFASFSTGGNEHKAALALLAEFQSRRGLADPALTTLNDLQPLLEADDRSFLDVAISRVKILWLQGQFVEAKSECESLLKERNLERFPLHEACFRSGQALAQLCLAESLDDAFALRDPARMVVKAIEPYQSAPLPLAVAEMNYGTAEAIYSHIVGKENQVEVPLDNAMRAWRRGLTTIKRHRKDNLLASHIGARLEAQMAWGLLKMTEHRNHVEQALDHAGKSLKFYDRWLTDDPEKEGLERTLALLARCYHKSSQAVTAEGLLQSALDRKGGGPQYFLERHHIQTAYASLCRDWEKREPDADRLDNDARTTMSSLPPAWQGKIQPFAHLWFWTPNLFA